MAAAFATASPEGLVVDLNGGPGSRARPVPGSGSDSASGPGSGLGTGSFPGPGPAPGLGPGLGSGPDLEPRPGASESFWPLNSVREAIQRGGNGSCQMR